MKPSMLDTDVLSEFLRGNRKVVAKVDEHLREYGYINLSIITYYEIPNLDKPEPNYGFCMTTYCS